MVDSDEDDFLVDERNMSPVVVDEEDEEVDLGGDSNDEGDAAELSEWVDGNLLASSDDEDFVDNEAEEVDDDEAEAEELQGDDDEDDDGEDISASMEM